MKFRYISCTILDQVNNSLKQRESVILFHQYIWPSEVAQPPTECKQQVINYCFGLDSLIWSNMTRFYGCELLPELEKKYIKHNCFISNIGLYHIRNVKRRGWLKLCSSQILCIPAWGKYINKIKTWYIPLRKYWTILAMTPKKTGWVKCFVCIKEFIYSKKGKIE